MSERCNRSKHEQATAILDFYERLVRDQLPDADDVDSDFNFMAECVDAMVRRCAVLSKQVQTSSWSDSFVRVLEKSNAMRIVPIDRASKDAHRQRAFRCDACGSNEHCCAYAIDLLGGVDAKHARRDFGGCRSICGCWLSNTHPATSYWGVAHGISADWKAGRTTPPNHDWGRYFVGKTCLRKVQIYFEARNLPRHLLLQAADVTRGMSHEECAEAKHVYAVDEYIDALLEHERDLEWCVAKDCTLTGAHKIGDTNGNDEWIRVDRDRIMKVATSGMADEARVVDVARGNATLLLSAANCFASQSCAGTSRSRRSADVVDVDSSDEEDCDEDEEENDEHEEDGESDFIVEDDEEIRPMKRSTRSHKKRPVISDSESDDEECRGRGTCWARKAARRQIDSNVTPRVTRLQAAAQKRAADLVVQNPVLADTESTCRSTRQQSCRAGPSSSNALASPPVEQQPRLSSTDVDPEARAATTEPELSDDETTPAAPAPAHGPAQSMAIAMRIGRGGVRELPSRNAALMGLLQVSTELTRRSEHDLAQLVDVAVLTMRELMEIAQRARGRANVE